VNYKNIKILQKALSSSDKVLMREALKIAIQHKEIELQASAETKDYSAYRRQQLQYAQLNESLHSLSFN